MPLHLTVGAVISVSPALRAASQPFAPTCTMRMGSTAARPQPPRRCGHAHELLAFLPKAAESDALERIFGPIHFRTRRLDNAMGANIKFARPRKIIMPSNVKGYFG